MIYLVSSHTIEFGLINLSWLSKQMKLLHHLSINTKFKRMTLKKL